MTQHRNADRMPLGTADAAGRVRARKRTDEVLVVQAARGDATALAESYDRYGHGTSLSSTLCAET